MDFSEDIITRMLKNENAGIFLCDAQLRVTEVGTRLQNGRSPILPGQALASVFPGHDAELSAALLQLEKGAPYFSTNFEHDLSYSTFLCLPVMEGDTLSMVLCCLVFSGSSDLSAVMPAALPAFSDRCRTPISTLLNLLAKLAPKFQESEDYVGLDCLNEAARCCYQIMRSASMLQEFYLLASHRMPYTPRKMLIGQFLGDLCHDLSHALNSAGYVFQYRDETAEPLTIVGDERLLTRAVYHLLTNACIYSPKGARIEVTLSAGENTVCIQVADEGIGIQPADLQDIFEPFVVHRDVPVPEEEMGMGLGLPIVKRTTELHGGSVMVSSKPNEGTKMLLTLPLCTELSGDLTVHSGQRRYVNELFSDFHVLFSDICKTKLF